MLRKFALLLCLVMALSLSACSFQPKPTEPDYNQFTNPPATESLEEVEELSLVVTEDTIATLEKYPNLKKADLSGSTCYSAIQDYVDAHPEVDVTYTVSLGGSELSCTTSGLILEPGSFHYITLVNNLRYLPNVTTVSLPETDLTMEQIDALKAAYPKVEITASFMVAGMELGAETTELDLSGFDVANLDTLVEKLPLLTRLEKVELMDAEGNSVFTLDQVRQMKAAQPNAVFNWLTVM